MDRRWCLCVDASDTHVKSNGVQAQKDSDNSLVLVVTGDEGVSSELSLGYQFGRRVRNDIIVNCRTWKLMMFVVSKDTRSTDQVLLTKDEISA